MNWTCLRVAHPALEIDSACSFTACKLRGLVDFRLAWAPLGDVSATE